MSFLFPSFLFSLFAFSIPVIIHLFNFRRYKKIFFTNVNFIASVQEETKSQNNLRHLLLLLLRLLALAAIIFAFAQPFIPQKQSTVNPGKNYIALYIDNSFSMSNTAKEGELLQFAKKKTEEIAKSYSEGDGYQLVTNDFDIKHRHWVTQKEVIKLISEVSVSPASKKLSEVYAHMREAYRDVNAHNKLAYIVSDYQTSFADISATAKDRDTSINLYSVQVNSGTRNNIYIDSVWFEGAIWQLNQSNTIVAKIINASEEPVEEGTLTLTINGKQKSLANFSIPAKGNKEIKMNFTVTEKGNNQASVTITDYPITFDDAFYFNFNVADEVGILCVNGTKKAPEIIRAFNAEKAFKVEEVSASNLDYSGFASHKFIILNGVENISSGFASALSEYAKNGGNVLLIPDENINTNSYNEYLQAEGAPMLSTLNNTGYKVNDFAVKNPFFAGVFDDISANINLPEVKKYYSVSTSKNTNVNVLMRLANGDAFLTQSTAGKGFIYVLASGINKDWCNLTNHALFLPLMYRMALYTENSGRIAYAIGKDNYVQIAPTMLKQSGQNNDKKEVVKIFKNKFEVTPPQRAVDGALSLYVEGFIREAGHYSVGSPNEKATNSVSFNYDRNESIMKFLTADELKEKGAALNMKFLDATKASMTTAVKEINQGNSLWKYFIIAAIIFLLGETVLTRIWR